MISLKDQFQNAIVDSQNLMAEATRGNEAQASIAAAIRALAIGLVIASENIHDSNLDIAKAIRNQIFRS